MTALIGVIECVIVADAGTDVTGTEVVGFFGDGEEAEEDGEAEMAGGNAKATSP